MELNSTTMEATPRVIVKFRLIWKKQNKTSVFMLKSGTKYLENVYYKGATARKHLFIIFPTICW